jgi:hypothetical protein
MTMADGFLSVSRRIEAPVEQLFALLADSANHPLIDGSGMVREPAPAVKVSGTGDVFMINMHNDHDGNYQVRNVVVEYLADRRLVWAPMTPTSDPQEQHAVDPDRYEWGYELAPDGPGATVVTETFDCRRAPQDLRKRLRDGETWRDSMAASLVKLELLAKTRGQQ